MVTLQGNGNVITRDERNKQAADVIQLDVSSHPDEMKENIRTQDRQPQPC